MSGPHVEIGVLGPSTLVVDGVPAPLASRRMRSLLAALALGPGPTVSSDRLVDAVWNGAPPPVATNTVQGYISRMRRLVDAPGGSAAPGSFIRHTAGGYLLALGPDDRVDACYLDAGIRSSQALLQALPDPTRPALAEHPGQVELHRERLEQLLLTWRGEPYADLGDDPAAVIERRRLGERRLEGEIALTVMDLMLGRAPAAASRLESIVDAHPLREQLWRLWAVALVRCDRQAHALDVLGRLRTLLVAELGIDPSPAVADLQEAILRQDPSVLGTTRPATPRSGSHSPVRELRPIAARPPLVGRDRELHLLQEAVRATSAGHGRHVVVVGPAGTGKTRLVSELLAWARGHTDVAVVSTGGAAHGDAPRCWPLRRLVADLGRQIGPSTTEEALDDADAFGVATALLDAARTAATVRPVVLVVDDVDRLDAAVVAALSFLAESLVDLPVMLLTTQRPGSRDNGSESLAVATARAGGLWLELRNLDADAAHRLARQLGFDRTGTDDIDLPMARTAGNPRHLTTLLEQPTDGVPPSLAALTRDQLLELPAGAAEILWVAAASGRRFTDDALLSSRVAPDGDLEPALDSAHRAGLLRPTEDGWEFASPLLHEAVLASGPRELGTGAVRVPPRRGKKSQLSLVAETREA